MSDRSESTKQGLREELALLLWTASGGTHWDEVRDMPAPAADERCPNYVAEKVAETWATVDAITARYRLMRKPSRALASGIPVEGGGGDVG